MLGDEAKRNQLIGALDEHDLVKAALIVDHAGAVKARVGDAHSLLTSAGAARQGDSDAGLAKENVYLVGAGDHFLIAIFDDGIEFDRLKADVDAVIEELDL